MQDLAAVKISSPILPPEGYAFGSFSARALALTIDQFILFGVIIILVIPVTFLVGFASLMAWPFVFVIFTPTVMPVTTIIAWLYFAAQESSRHQGTFGKRMCGLRVTDIRGNPITFSRATIRFFGKFLSSAIMLIGWIMAAFTERHQALHDMIADTLVLKKRK